MLPVLTASIISVTLRICDASIAGCYPSYVNNSTVSRLTEMCLSSCLVIEQKQELLARESISHPALDYSEGMTAEEQKRYINYLAERVREADLGLRARDLVLQDFLDKQKEYDERLSKLDAVLSRVDSLESSLKDEIKRRKTAERKVDDLKAKLKFANKNRFGDKSYGSKRKDSDDESDRTKDKDDFI